MNARIVKTISTLALCIFSLSPAEARDVESTERLRLLQRTTGQTPSTSSFQARVDAIFETHQPSLDQSYVTREDTEMKQALALKLEDSKLLLEEKKKNLEKEENEKDSKGKKENIPLEIPLDPGIDAGEKNYQKQIHEIYEEWDQRKEEIKEEDRPQPEEDKKRSLKSDLPSSLANSPFYFASDENQKSFEENKAIIINRLVQMGYAAPDAESLVQEASSPEEVIIALMQQEGLSYGDAMNTVRSGQED